MKAPFLLFALLLPVAAAADVEMHFTDGSYGLVDDGRVLFGDKDDVVLFEPGSDSMVVISHRERTWMRLEKGFAKDMKLQMQSQMEAMLAGMPPEQRAMVEAQMQAMMPSMNDEPPAMSVRPTGRSDEVAGYDCAEAEITYDDGAIEESVCIASRRELGISSEDFDALVGAMQGMAEVASLNPNAAPQADFRKLGGMPIRTTQRNGTVHSELARVDTSNVDAARLAIPDDYRQVTIEEMMNQ